MENWLSYGSFTASIKLIVFSCLANSCEINNNNIQILMFYKACAKRAKILMVAPFRLDIWGGCLSPEVAARFFSAHPSISSLTLANHVPPDQPIIISDLCNPRSPEPIHFHANMLPNLAFLTATRLVMCWAGPEWPIKTASPAQTLGLCLGWGPGQRYDQVSQVQTFFSEFFFFFFFFLILLFYFLNDSSSTSLLTQCWEHLLTGTM